MKRLLLLLFLLCSSYAYADITTGLVGWWKFDEGSGSTATDSSGNGNDGTEESSPTYVAGHVGSYALSFNGTSSYIDLGTPASLNLSGANAFTLSAWVYPLAYPTGSGVIAEMYTPTSHTVQYEIGFGIDAGTDNKLKVGFFDDGQGGWFFTSDSADITLSQWIFITGTWDGTNLLLYKNGILVGSSTPAAHLPSTYIDDYVIGRRHDPTGSPPFFPGYIDDARIYNRALSQGDVTELYNYGVTHPNNSFSNVKIIELTSGSTWKVPLDWNNASNKIEVIGGGAGGTLNGYGGGGGAYAKVTNISLTPGSTVAINVGAGGAAGSSGGDTYFCNSTSNCSSISGSAVVVGAKAGTPEYGGSATASIGTTKYPGGSSVGPEHCGAVVDAGGGGAGGPHGNGGPGLGNGYCDGLGPGGAGGGGGGGGSPGQFPDAGGNGGNNYNGTGGGIGGGFSGAGLNGFSGGGGGGGADAGVYSGDGGIGSEWDSTHGSGGGGGAAGNGLMASEPVAQYGGNGGLYGGGGGSSTVGGYATGIPGAGAQGIIVITYNANSNYVFFDSNF